MNDFKEIEACLVCGNKDLKACCDLGQQPLVNNLKSSPEEKEHIFPIVVNECDKCTHKQLSVSVNRDLLFKEYLYQTGVSLKHIEFFIDFVWDREKKGRVLDIGCNDGALLREFALRGSECVGIDPSAKIDLDFDCTVIKDYFPSENIKGKFDFITAFNVFAHNDDPKTFLIKMSNLLKEDGRIYVLTTPARLSNYYHEHISYFTPQSMMVLAQRCGVEVVSFKEVAMHGKSYLFELANEKDDEIQHDPYLTGNVVAYGASASEIVLFNYYKIHPEYVVDDNPLKQGKFIPGINSPIVSSDYFSRESRDLTVIVAHNLFDEISAKINKLRPKNKDQFVRLI